MVLKSSACDQSTQVILQDVPTRPVEAEGFARLRIDLHARKVLEAGFAPGRVPVLRPLRTPQRSSVRRGQGTTWRRTFTLAVGWKASAPGAGDRMSRRILLAADIPVDAAITDGFSICPMSLVGLSSKGLAPHGSQIALAGLMPLRACLRTTAEPQHRVASSRIARGGESPLVRLSRCVVDWQDFAAGPGAGRLDEDAVAGGREDYYGGESDGQQARRAASGWGAAPRAWGRDRRCGRGADRAGCSPDRTRPRATCWDASSLRRRSPGLI